MADRFANVVYWLACGVAALALVAGLAAAWDGDMTFLALCLVAGFMVWLWASCMRSPKQELSA
jgi:hypothetical protein